MTARTSLLFFSILLLLLKSRAHVNSLEAEVMGSLSARDIVHTEKVLMNELTMVRVIPVKDFKVDALQRLGTLANYNFLVHAVIHS